MANDKNLKPALTKNEARERGRAGGIASGLARRRRRAFCKILQELSDLPASNASEIADEFPGLAPADITNLFAMGTALLKKGLSGDAKAIETILHLTSQNRTVDAMDMHMAPVNLFNPLY